MKNAGYISTILLLCSLVATAQKNDTVYIKNSLVSGKNDTLFVKMITNEKVYDTFFLKNKSSINKKDSFFPGYSSATYVFKDSVYVFRKKDSTGRYPVYIAYQKDSLQKKQFKRSKASFVIMDSLHQLNSQLYTLQSKKNFQYQKYQDSTGSYKWRSDSVRLKGELNRLKSNLQRIKEDSLRSRNKLNKKEVSMEVSCNSNANIIIKNLSRKVTIKTFNEKKVKIVTVVFAEPGVESRDIDWTKVLNVDIAQNKNEVIIQAPETRTATATATATGNGSISMSYSNNAVVNGGNVEESRMYRTEKKSELIIYIPAEARLNINNRYNEVNILNNLTSLDADLMNANLRMLDADKAKIKSRYGSVKAGNIKDADLDLMNCNFKSGGLEKLKINSKYSTVTFSNSGVIDMLSVSDQYNIESADYITATKSFGKLNLAELSNSIVLTGSSADLNIKMIKASVQEVKIDNKYADVKLPLAKLENYTLQFEGKYSNVFTPFEKIKMNNTDSMKTSYANFTKTVGSIKNKFTAFDVSCTSCSVDFR